MDEKKEILQWHPAFFATIQIELQEEAANLIFENEHHLGTKPRQIDILVIKKEAEKRIHKNIGRIFRKYNIIEYKSPTDYLSIDDYYKVYAYACLYKADAILQDSISIEEITISLICSKYPKKLIKHLREDLGYKVEQIENGIYYVEGDRMPIQIILNHRLSKKENFWLGNLTDHLDNQKEIQKLIKEYGKYKSNKLYRAVMNIIVNANKEKFKEVYQMCEALEELMKDEMDAMRKQGLEQGIKQGIEQGIEQGRKEGLEEGLERGLEQGIQGFIETCKELGIPKRTVLSKLEIKFQMSSKAASRGYLAKYWK